MASAFQYTTKTAVGGGGEGTLPIFFGALGLHHPPIPPAQFQKNPISQSPALNGGRGYTAV